MKYNYGNTIREILIQEYSIDANSDEQNCSALFRGFQLENHGPVRTTNHFLYAFHL